MIGEPAYVAQLLLMHPARLDHWRNITKLGGSWGAGGSERTKLEAAASAMEAVEAFHDYPGPKQSAALREQLAADGSTRLAGRISSAQLTRARRERPLQWDLHAEMTADELADVLPPGLREAEGRRLYFQALFVSAKTRGLKLLRPNAIMAKRKSAAETPGSSRAA